MKTNQALKLSFAIFLIIIAFFITGLQTLVFHPPQRVQSCSTFLFEKRDTLLIGHNLDDYIDVPGLVVINPRNVSKHSISWNDLNSFFGKSEPKLHWISKYASMTYNTFGKEFIDGGLNETGLYVGEMTLFGTEYPKDEKLIRLYHHFWMQYLLDNYSTVQEVISSLSGIAPDGHCQWHFFLADRNGNAAVIEFLKGKLLIYTGESLPYKILCNDSYKSELEDLPNYQGFGGTKIADQKYEKEDPRFRWGLVMMKGYDSLTKIVNYGFSILKRLDMGNNKWSIIYDVKNLRMYFNTYKSRNIRFVDLRHFDVSGKSPAMVLDINRDLSGDVTTQFMPFSDEIQRQYVQESWNNIDAGFFGNLFFKPRMINRLSSYIKDFDGKQLVNPTR
jgi:penicillin V acylase-like amidase (Ntn superfamily)